MQSVLNPIVLHLAWGRHDAIDLFQSDAWAIPSYSEQWLRLWQPKHHILEHL
jgi:hypothetical protein